MPQGRKIHLHIPAAFIMIIILAACAIGPDYKRPAAVKPAAYKESAEWKLAQPKDAAIRSKWWELFNDPQLNTLEEQVNINNENIKAAAAAWRQARALVAEARAGYFPTATLNSSATRSRIARNDANAYAISLGASWEPDFWGRIARSVESSKATAQASNADLASARLSAQSDLAVDYLQLRVADKQKRLLEDTVKNYRRSLQITKNLYKVGVDAKSDVMQAQVQLESAEAQEIDVGVTRAQLEHAIAMLIGKAPAEFSLDAVPAVPAIPIIPTGVPSQLLERRPDIAASERRVAAANAQIGVTEAVFFPAITLSASGGYNAGILSQWFSLPNRVWSIGPSLVETIFDAGLRSAQTEAAIAAYDQTVATYRQTVLNAFQAVEDNLASLRILQQEAAVQHKAVADAEKTVAIILNQYKAGTTSYLSVVTAQATALTNELTELNIERGRVTAAANLISNLGGGWDESELNKPSVVQPKTTPLSILPAVTPSTPR